MFRYLGPGFDQWGQLVAKQGGQLRRGKGKGREVVGGEGGRGAGKLDFSDRLQCGGCGCEKEKRTWRMLSVLPWGE